MQRLVLGWVVAAVAVLIPQGVFGGNQEIAERIAANLRNSGRLQAYRIGIRYDEGTVWLRGQVSSLQQMNEALTIVAKSNGVRRVVNELKVAPPAEKTASRQPSGASKQNTLQQIVGAVTGEKVSRKSSTNRWPLTMRTQPTRAHQPAKRQAPAPAVPVANTTVEQAPRLAAPTAPAVTAVAQQQQVPQPAPAAAPKPLAVPAAQQAQMVPQAPQTMPTQVTQVMVARMARPLPIAYVQPVAASAQAAQGPVPQYVVPAAAGVAPVRYDQPHLPNYAWPSYAAYPNYAAITYPRQYSPTAWPYIGPFYPYPQVPLGWRKVSLQWHDGWWFLDFDDGSRSKGLLQGLLHPCR